MGEITGRHTLVTVVISLLPVWCILLCGHRHTHSSEQQRQCCSWNVIRFVYERKRKAIFVFIVSQRSYLDICCCRRLSVFGRRCAQSMQLTSCVCVCVCVCVCEVLPLLSKKPGSRDTLPSFGRPVLSRCH